MDTLNGGLGDDTYSFTLGDGNDVINEAVYATSGGTADRISILAPITGTDPLTGLPILTLTLSTPSTTMAARKTAIWSSTTACQAAPSSQTITVAGSLHRHHCRGPASSASTSTAPPSPAICSEPTTTSSAASIRTTATAAALILPPHREQLHRRRAWRRDVITGGSGNDLIFGGTGDNDLVGGDGDDLLVGGSGR